MSEQSCKPARELYNRAISKAMLWHDQWNLDLFSALNPSKLSPADIDLLTDYVSLPERPY